LLADRPESSRFARRRAGAPCYKSAAMTRSTRDPAAKGAPGRARPLTRAPDAEDSEAAPEPENTAEIAEVSGDSPALNDDARAASNDPDDGATERGTASSDPDLPPADGADAREHHAPEERERDRLLVERAQTGDHAAFRQLFDRYHKRAYSVAYGVLKNRHDAMDVVQEGFVKVHKHLASFQGSSSFYTWLYRIVMNLAIDQLRRRKTSRPVEYDDAIAREGDGTNEAILPRMADANPRKAAIRRELIEKIDAALAELPEYHRQVILLREIEGLSYEEMAEVLEVPKGTIMSRLFHARKKMQAALAGYVDGDMDIE
jgi:RNA polymerase sigma-70 factor (ECF subfamily)